MRPRRIVGTSMGAIIGAALAAGRSPDAIEADAGRAQMHRLMRRRGRLALFDPRRVLEHVARELGDPDIEDLPIPLGITAYDLVAGRPRLITSGRLIDALEVSIAVPLFFPPRRDRDGVWCDAGPWEGIPVTLARAWAPSLPVDRRPGRHPEAGISGQPARRGLPACRFVAARGRRRLGPPDRAPLPGPPDQPMGRPGRARAARPAHRAPAGPDECAPVRAHRAGRGHRRARCAAGPRVHLGRGAGPCRLRRTAASCSSTPIPTTSRWGPAAPSRASSPRGCGSTSSPAPMAPRARSTIPRSTTTRRALGWPPFARRSWRARWMRSVVVPSTTTCSATGTPG